MGGNVLLRQKLSGGGLSSIQLLSAQCLNFIQSWTLVTPLTVYTIKCSANAVKPVGSSLLKYNKYIAK